jgi:predicted nuclease of predicted toxin-antitoxin system
VKLLFDQNLSPKLIADLGDCFPDSIHVRDVGLHVADDITVWNYAAENYLAIVTKDADFRQRSFLEGYPPKIIWITLGNCSTTAIESILRRHRGEIDVLLADAETSLIALPRPGK